MLPSLLAREVQTGLKQFLRTGFEPTDPLFAGVMRRFTDNESRWMKGPYVQIGLPFRTGTHGRGFFAGFQTEFPGFVHQETAWQRLATNRLAAATLVATGTGSGKTECFLYPVLDHVAREREKGQGGIQALVIYPMNALASDQARRFAQIIAKTPRFKGLRVGLFVGGKTGKDGKGQMTMTPTEVITDRDTLRKDPPDILLTNYKMLDYLLIRPRDRRLWSKNQPKTLRYVVVDELHTFDGAQGTDLALLLRRLKSRLKVPEGHLIHVGTSATLGGNANTDSLREYARQVFGADFPPESVVTESRLTDLEFLGDGTIEHVLHASSDFESRLKPERYSSQEEAISAWFPLFFPGATPPADVGQTAWRSELGSLLRKHLLFINLLKLVKGQIVSVTDLQLQMLGPLPENVRPHIGLVLDALLALVAWARDPDGRPLVTLRIQLWLRELRRMVATVRKRPENIDLRSDRDLNPDSGRIHLPLVQCTDCHTTGWLSRLPAGGSKVSTILEEIYNTWFAGQPETVRLYAAGGLKRPQCDGVPRGFCASCGQLQSGNATCTACGQGEIIDVFQVTATRTSKSANGVVHSWHDSTCPACGSSHAQILLGARNATLGAVTIEQTWASPFNDDKKLIAFSDSVQDAAHRAGFFTARTYQNTVRTGLAKIIDRVAKPQCPWPVFLEAASGLWRDHESDLKMDEERFVSEFIGPNMTWQRDWAEGLQTEDRLPPGSRLPERVAKRLAWQAFAEFTYLSRRGRNLETVGKAVLTPRISSMADAAAAVLPVLREHLGLRNVREQTVLQWLWGIACHLRMRGAVAHPEMAALMVDGNIFAFSKGSNRKEWLPGLGPRSAQPRFLSLGPQEHFDVLVHPKGKTFYQNWLEATLNADGLLPDGIEFDACRAAIRALVDVGVLIQVTGRTAEVVGLNPNELLLETRIARLISTEGKRGLTVPAEVADQLLGMPCLQAPQEHYSTFGESVTWSATQFSRGDLRRVFSAEHTGLLQREQRETLELRFKTRNPPPWYENLLSATPTLEMGVDIGDLSSVMLCSVPPNQASYLQRIGRAGRRDGNAFTVTLADGASPHDLYFFEDTQEMLAGEVISPGIFLKAPEVLRRQLFAFCLDEWVGSGIADSALPDKTQDALNARDSQDLKRFPYTFLDFLHAHEDRLLTAFQSLLGTDLDDRVAQRLEGFMKGTNDGDSLKMRLHKLMEELAKERKSHSERGAEIKARIKQLSALPQDEATREEIARMERERNKALELVKEINQRDLLETLTDAGLIPNYAFPEAGVELKSLLWRKRSSDDPNEAGAYISLPAERYERPAHSALSEFAPENIFYANQRRVEVDQINMELSTLETWRLCPNCQHMRNVTLHADSDGACPRCGDPKWADISQKRQLLRFKQAIANSNDTEVRIDDSAEDREPKFYVRQMMTDFEPGSIKEAYRLKSDETPFGFEFIDRVTFRDVNFGEPTKPGAAYAVAGQQRPRPGFRVCRYCGQVQRPPRTDREKKLPQMHAFDCAKRDSGEPENLIECLYLYREFTSEALRILMPYTKSGVDEASVQSFMAAVRIGLKRRFGGRVDHLRIITQEESGQDGAASRHYVLLYDSVPGGTGYLHELLSDGAKTLAAVLRMALAHLAGCSCHSDPEKDGCYRCVYQYRLGRAMEHVSRDRAQAILEQLVGSLDELERVKSVAEIYVNPNFDSELEARFVESLRRLGGKGGLPFVSLVQDIIRGKSGYLLEVGEQRYWIEPQVDIGTSDGMATGCRPDFVLTPTQSRSARRPIAVFCDGWNYHQAITREDAAKRNGLVSSGRYWVWSITWEDVKAALDEKVEGDLEPELTAMASGLLRVQFNSMFDRTVWTLNAVSGLLRWLASPPTPDADPYAEKLGRHAWVTAAGMVPHPQRPEEAPARAKLAQFWQGLEPLPCERPLPSVASGNVNESGIFIRYWWPPAFAMPNSPLLPSPGFVVLDESTFHTESERHYAWRRWLGLFNVFQTLPGILLATRAGLDNHDHGSLQIRTGMTPARGGGSEALAAGWNVVLDQTIESLSDGLRRLRDEGAPVPDEVGFEFAVAEKVLAEAELAWTARKLVLLLTHQTEFAAIWGNHGWTIVVAEGDWPQTLSEQLRQSTDASGQPKEGSE